MPRRKLHPKLAAINGAKANHPERYKDVLEDREEPIGDPPKYLGPTQKKIWSELVEQSVPGLLTVSDREGFAYLVRLVSAARRGKPNAAMARELRMFLGVYGMTPAERARIPAKAQGKAKPKSDRFGKVS